MIKDQEKRKELLYKLEKLKENGISFNQFEKKNRMSPRSIKNFTKENGYMSEANEVKLYNGLAEIARIIQK